MKLQPSPDEKLTTRFPPFLLPSLLFSAWLHEGFHPFLNQLYGSIFASSTSVRQHVIDYRRHELQLRGTQVGFLSEP